MSAVLIFDNRSLLDAHDASSKTTAIKVLALTRRTARSGSKMTTEHTAEGWGKRQ